MKSFEKERTVKTKFIEPFGFARKYPGGPVVPNAIIGGSSIFRSGYVVNSEATPYYVYDSLYWNRDGEMYLVNMRLAKDKAPSFC